jgi:hypothetical protein
MGTRGLGGFKGLLLGSVTTKVIHLAGGAANRASVIRHQTIYI